MKSYNKESVMQYRYALIFALTALMSSLTAQAADDFVPEIFTVKKSIDAGPNAYLIDQNWYGVSQINVMSSDGFVQKGNITTGLNAQFVLSRDHKTAYTISIYPKRIVSGPVEAVLQEFDVSTLSLKREIPISPKMVLSAPQINYVQLSVDERYAYVQNATPATSVSVVDLKEGKMIAEVPTPGCFGIYPAPQGARFSSICGNGSLTSYSFSEDGAVLKPVKSEKIFDADTDPLYIHAVRAENDLVFTSYHGNLYRVSDAVETGRLIDKFSYTKGVKGKWGPGGVALMAYNQANNVLFINMHPNAKNGSHKDPGKEVWAINLSTKKVLSRSVINNSNSLAVTQDKKPVLFSVDAEDAVLSRYETNPAANFKTKFVSKFQAKGEYTYLVWLDR
jgi:methylamine dehydrogenase heavy chain